MKPEAILFDLDGTLVDTERESAEAMARALAAAGVDCDDRDRDYIVGRSWVDIYAELKLRYRGLSLGLLDLMEQTAIAREEIFRESGIRVLQGAKQAIARFPDTPLALVTGSSRREAAQALVALGLGDAFRFVIAAEDVPTGKPDPGGYLMAARRLAVDVKAAVVVEDSHAGIWAGVHAGAAVVGVRAGNFGGQDQSAAHALIETLDELTPDFLYEMMKHHRSGFR